MTSMKRSFSMCGVSVIVLSIALRTEGFLSSRPLCHDYCSRRLIVVDEARVSASDVRTDVGGSTEEEPVNGLVSQKDMRSQLFASFSALNLVDQYDAVLTGLCAKIVDNKIDPSGANLLNDPMQLLQEMNDKRLVASPRSIMALIDATVKAQDATVLGSVMSLCSRNGGAKAYGKLLTDITSLPVTPSTRCKCPDGTFKSRQERLASVNDLPDDQRVQEVAAALTTMTVAASCELTNIVPGLSDYSPVANIILTAMVTVGVVDNCYDLIQKASDFAIQQLGKNMEQLKNMKMPDKDSMPLGIGTGKATSVVVRGLSRLLTVDTAREARAEAAALFVAYSLGLPVFCFRANALEASVLAVDKPDEMLSDTGILRLLMWLLAPVAAESELYPILISSDPREAPGFLDRLEQVANNKAKVAQALWWLEDPQERTDLLKWAFAETNVLLRENKKMVQELAERLEGGAATIGDCVAVLEQW